jgi:hypothetical protein
MNSFDIKSSKNPSRSVKVSQSDMMAWSPGLGHEDHTGGDREYILQKCVKLGWK